jgi:hypothetical protein
MLNKIFILAWKFVRRFIKPFFNFLFKTFLNFTTMSKFSFLPKKATDVQNVNAPIIHSNKPVAKFVEPSPEQKAIIAKNLKSKMISKPFLFKGAIIANGSLKENLVMGFFAFCKENYDVFAQDTKKAIDDFSREVKAYKDKAKSATSSRFAAITTKTPTKKSTDFRFLQTAFYATVAKTNLECIAKMELNNENLASLGKYFQLSILHCLSTMYPANIAEAANAHRALSQGINEQKAGVESKIVLRILGEILTGLRLAQGVANNISAEFKNFAEVNLAGDANKNAMQMMHLVYENARLFATKNNTANTFSKVFAELVQMGLKATTTVLENLTNLGLLYQEIENLLSTISNGLYFKKALDVLSVSSEHQHFVDEVSKQIKDDYVIVSAAQIEKIEKNLEIKAVKTAESADIDDITDEDRMAAVEALSMITSEPTTLDAPKPVSGKGTKKPK